MSKVTRIAVRSGLFTDERTTAEVHRDNDWSKWRTYTPSASSLERMRTLARSGKAKYGFVNLMPLWISVWIEPVKDGGNNG